MNDILIDTIDKLNIQAEDLDFIPNPEELLANITNGRDTKNNSTIEEMTFLGDDESTFFSNMKQTHPECIFSTTND